MRRSPTCARGGCKVRLFSYPNLGSSEPDGQGGCPLKAQHARIREDFGTLLRCAISPKISPRQCLPSLVSTREPLGALMSINAQTCTLPLPAMKIAFIASAKTAAQEALQQM